MLKFGWVLPGGTGMWGAGPGDMGDKVMPDVNAHFKRRFSRELIRCYFCQGEGVRSLKEEGKEKKKHLKLYLHQSLCQLCFLSPKCP